jgi:hypothetical protein
MLVVRHLIRQSSRADPRCAMIALSAALVAVAAPRARAAAAPAAEVAVGAAPCAAPRAAPQSIRLFMTNAAVLPAPSVVLSATEELSGDASGVVQLLPAPSPFGIAVSPDGSTRYRVRVSLCGLPAPAALGPYTTYVVWVSTWLVDQTERLGAALDGERDLGEVHWNKFRILVTAERTATVRAPAGPILLRGSSPSGRMLPHDVCHLGYGGPC